jgi:hypothetical protein
MIDQVRKGSSLSGSWRYRKDADGTGITDGLFQAETDGPPWRSPPTGT